ncbi:hypothetical protein [Neisseria lactamica]|nr:hypothetical protein [Neisseria lactamica]
MRSDAKANGAAAQMPSERRLSDGIRLNLPENYGAQAVRPLK